MSCFLFPKSSLALPSCPAPCFLLPLLHYFPFLDIYSLPHVSLCPSFAHWHTLAAYSDAHTHKHTGTQWERESKARSLTGSSVICTSLVRIRAALLHRLLLMLHSSLSHQTLAINGRERGSLGEKTEERESDRTHGIRERARLNECLCSAASAKARVCECMCLSLTPSLLFFSRCSLVAWHRSPLLLSPPPPHLLLQLPL